MDPLSAAATIVSLADITLRLTSNLIEYTKNTAHASVERKILLKEALSLSTILERLRARHATPSGGRLIDWDTNIISQYKSALDDLAKLLGFDQGTRQPKHQSRIKSMAFAATWSFSKAEVYNVIERITRLQQYALSLLVDEQYEMVEQMNSRQLDAAALQHKNDVLKWLSPMQDEAEFNAVLSRVAKGSGRWFIESQAFTEWNEGRSTRIWCSGIPGAGKTVMATLVVEHLHQQLRNNTPGPNGLAFTYLKYNNPHQSLASIFGSLLRQLLNDQIVVPKEVTMAYDLHQKGLTPPDGEELARLLPIAMAQYATVFYVIDALDECDEQLRWDLLRCLEACEPRANILITSRSIDTIADELCDFSRYEIRAQAQDIELYIDAFVDRHKGLRRMVERSPKMRDDIKAAVVRNAEDMFLLATLHLESISRVASLSVGHVRTQLRKLPNSLEETYNEALARIEAQYPDQRSIALKTLAWVSYALRPMTVHELQHALAIEPGDTELDEESLIETHNITSLCAGLIVVNPSSATVSVVHHTAKRHLESIRVQKFPGFHAVITMTCATYLSLRQLKNLGLNKIIGKYPLACYAAQYMGEHARYNPEETLEFSVLQKICQLLTHPERRRPLLSLLDGLALSKGSVMQFAPTTGSGDKSPVDSEDGSVADSEFTLRDEDLYSEDSDDEDGGMFKPRPLARTITWEARFRASHVAEVTALHLAASMGLAKVASLLLNEVPDIDAVDESGKTPLNVAMERGFEKAVELLINSGASVDLTTVHGQGVFLRIIESDWVSVAEVVTARTLAEAEEKGPEEVDPRALLLTATYKESEKQLEALVGKPELRSMIDSTLPIALFVAVERGSVTLVEQLLASGVDVDARDNSGQTALHRATKRHNAEILCVLIAHGCEVDAKDDEGRTPWSANLRVARKPVLDILIEAGADPNTRGHQGVSELYTASENGELDVIKTMLSYGTNPSVRTQFRWAPLHWAAYFGHVECVKALLEAGAEPSPVSDQDATPLDLAIKAQHPEIIRLLRRKGAQESRDIENLREDEIMDPNASEWSTPLSQIDQGTSEASKLSLTFDKPIQQGLEIGQYLYPSTAVGPTDYIYQMSMLLSCPGETFRIRRAERRADMVEYPLAPGAFPEHDDLWTIQRNKSNLQSLQLTSGPQASERIKVDMTRDWTGGWKAFRVVGEESTYLFRTTPDWSMTRDVVCRWSTEDGTLLARTDTIGLLPGITFEHEPDRVMQETLIGCWVAKLWHESTPSDLSSLSMKNTPKSSRSRSVPKMQD